MKKCYQLCATNPKNSTLAICPPNNTIDYLDIYNYIVTNQKFPFDLKLTKSVLTSNGIRNEDNFSNLATTWFDIQYNEFAYNLFSERLKIIEKRMMLSSFDLLLLNSISSCHLKSSLLQV